MSLFGKFIARHRLREAARALATNQSAANYIKLARLNVVAGNIQDVLRVCTEGLDEYPDDAVLERLAERAHQIELDQHVRQLYEELSVAPRPALWRQLCEDLLSAGRIQRATEVARQWYSLCEDGEALYYCAKVSTMRFFSDRRSEDGRQAFSLAEESGKLMKGDPRPLELQLEIASRVGAFEEARKSVARLLELKPGDPKLEARFRRVLARCDESRPIEQCFVRVERTGSFVDDKPESTAVPTSVSIRPLLQELSADSDVKGAIYLRGGTALVQGPRGATADRTARAVREVVHHTRASCRRMVLGRPSEILLEGTFGSLLLSPGQQGSAALWCNGPVKRKHELLLKKLSGMAGQTASMGGAA